MDYRDIETMLPVYVNGKLSAEDSKKVEEAMDEDVSIKAEIEFLRHLCNAVKEEEIESPSAWGLARLRRSVKKVQTSSQGIALWWKPIAVAASLAFVLQTGYLLFNQVTIDDTYTPLSTYGLENTIQVVFMETVTEAQIRSLLSEVEGQIVDGPSASGVYRISAKDLESALILLKNSDLISHAEMEE